MTRRRVSNLAHIVTALAILVYGQAFAQETTLHGIITGREGNSMTLRTQDEGKVTVLLSPSTQVDEVEGVLHARSKHLAMTALVPGLAVEVKGADNAKNQVVADDVKFKGSSLKTAQDIQAGLQPTEQQVQANTAENQAQQKQLKQEQAEVSANKTAIVADNKRFGELADYNILGEVTVLFGNGKAEIEPQYKPQLAKLAQQAKGTQAYILQVQGYASKVGSAALNQKLSAERAENVTDFLEQQGGIPLTNILAPGAMGTSQQVAPDTTTEGQAENRRVVVRILQNKGIAGS